MSNPVLENIKRLAPTATRYTKTTFVEAAAKGLTEQLVKRNLTSVNGVDAVTWVRNVLAKGVTYNLTATEELRKLRIQHVRTQMVDVWLLRCLREYPNHQD